MHGQMFISRINDLVCLRIALKAVLPYGSTGTERVNTLLTA